MSNNTTEISTPNEVTEIKDIPWCTYPRPQLKRDSFICLNGQWDFAFTDEDAAPRRYSEKITVPYPPESKLSGICRTAKKYEFLHYRRTFILPEGFIKDRVYIRFGAVDRLATVSINGTVVGTHNDGYLPFYADITDHLREGENEVHVKVRDNLSPLFPYGKQRKKRGGMWYTPTSGIWQTVWLESVPKNYIRKLKITPTLTEVKIEVFGGEGKKILTLKDYGKTFEFTDNVIVVRPEDPRLWSPEDPYLYDFKITTENDEIESYFALREVGICDTGRGKSLSLNGKPYLFNGLLDQGYFEDGIFTPKDVSAYEKDILTAKSLGFNMLRKHIKLEPAVFYYLCDKLGMAVFQDMVNNSKYSFLRDTALPTLGFKKLSDKHRHPNKYSRGAFEELMLGITNTLYNYPSVVYYTIFNEGWGQFSADDMYALLKSKDQTRVIDATSGWFWQKKSDVYSHHVYFKKLTAKNPPDRPTVMSEFGGYSLRIDGHLFSKKNYGYSTLKTREEFFEKLSSLYLDEVRMLAKEGVSAFVYTQISDVEDETNGFMTYDREVLKVDADKTKAIMDKVYEAFYGEVTE